jgi:hypothetical protein
VNDDSIIKQTSLINTLKYLLFFLTICFKLMVYRKLNQNYWIETVGSIVNLIVVKKIAKKKISK